MLTRSEASASGDWSGTGDGMRFSPDYDDIDVQWMRNRIASDEEVGTVTDEGVPDRRLEQAEGTAGPQQQVKG